MIRVPYGMSVHGEREISAVVEVLKNGTQMGKNVDLFEKRVAKLFNKKHGLMVNSGSSALFLIWKLLSLPAKSEVITPILTFSTTVSSIVQNRLVPAFVDVELDTFLIDIHRIEEAITPNTKAICVPNLLGNIAEWNELARIAQNHNLYLIEDSADTLGGTLGGESSGKYTDFSATSFYGSHIINCAGNGGMLCLNDDSLFKRAKLLRSWGRSSSIFQESERIENRFNVSLDGIPYDAKFVFEEMGYNLEPSELGAAFGLVQLENLGENIQKRKANFRKQYDFFSEFEEYFILPRQTKNSDTGWLAFPMIVKPDSPFSRKELQIFLEKNNIQTRVVFTGNILRQPGFKGIKCINREVGYPNADLVMQGGILLGCHHGMTDEMHNHIQGSFRVFLRSLKKK